MQKKRFFNADEINAVNEWVLDSRNSNLSAMKLLKFNLPKGDTRKFVMHSCEALIVPVAGELEIELCNERNVIGRFDAIYLTNGGSCEITALLQSEVLVCEAAAETSYRSVIIKRKDVIPVVSGSGCYSRNVWNMVSPDGIKAERLILGYCESVIDGGWTGWPPHEHGGNLEEIYYYYDISGPAPGLVQIISDDLRGHIEVELAKSGDVFAISEGFHPIVAFPGTRMKNLWFMAAVRPEDRDFGMIRVDSAF
jgi:5-deoxy-glucuronate isomerase